MNCSSNKIFLLKIVAFILFCFFSVTISYAIEVTETNVGRVQEIQGYIDGRSGTIFRLKDLQKGDVLTVNLASTGGNLDPMAGVLKDLSNISSYNDAILKELERGSIDAIESFSRMADELFLVWNDDFQTHYSSGFIFTVPAAGDYYLLIGSTVTNQSLLQFKPELTSGTFRLLLSLNEPDLKIAEAKPKGSPFAMLDTVSLSQPSRIQYVSTRLTEEKKVLFYQLKPLQEGDALSVRFFGDINQELPNIYLSDTGGKPLAYGQINKTLGVIDLNYIAKTEKVAYLHVNGISLSTLKDPMSLTLGLGVNMNGVFSDKRENQGGPVLEQSRDVQVNLEIDQIVGVDQKSENFTIVGSFELSWQDPFLAFSPDSCDCTVKNMTLDGLVSLAIKENIQLPLVTFYNQQGKRWAQDQQVSIKPNGSVAYLERFTATMQAPDFDFADYPFDIQKFNIVLDLNVPTESFVLKPIPKPEKVLSDQLGEEEWSVVNISRTVKDMPFGDELKHSRFTTSLTMSRHLNFYIIRIFLPLALIISISWLIFFLKDFSKQLDVASGNLLVFVAFNFTISDDLPRLGYLTFFDRVIITSFCCATIVVFISVFQKRLEAKGKMALASLIDKFVLISYPLVYVLFIAYEYRAIG